MLKYFLEFDTEYRDLKIFSRIYDIDIYSSILKASFFLLFVTTASLK